MSLSNEKRMFVDGYEQFQEKIGQLGKDHRIFVLFTGSKDEHGISWYVIHPYLSLISIDEI